jgi:phosphatidylglycerophosphatase A
LILAGLRLHEDYHRGLIPNLSIETSEQDFKVLNAGQMLGKTLANCMAGTTGVQTFLKFGKENPGILRELEPIANDVFKGLFAGLSSEVLASR